VGEVVVIRRGEIWWGESQSSQGRPYLVLTRDRALPVLRRVLVAPVTTRIRDLPSELQLGPLEGLRTECVATFDNVQPIAQALLVRRLGTLGPQRMHEICTAMHAAIDC
jgi:mRNA interferase MazF